MTKENTVAVIFESGQLSPMALDEQIKLQHRLQRAIEDMVEDGFTHFLLPLTDHYPLFPTTFIDAIEVVRGVNPNIRLTIMLLYEIDKRYYLSPAENYQYQLSYADDVIYYQREYLGNEPTNHIEYLLEKSAAVITYYETCCPQFSYITHHAQHSRLPLIDINVN